jgi:hypothetical protein
MTDVLDRLRRALADRYSVEREIGSGGMATVYHAQDLKHERQVAVKGRAPKQVTDFLCSDPSWDPDGASLWCRTPSDSTALVRVSMEGEVLAHYDASAVGVRGFGPPMFSPDGSRIYFTHTEEDGSRGVSWMPATGGDATQVVAFDDPSVYEFGILTVGPDHLYLTIAEYESDIYVMDLEW